MANIVLIGYRGTGKSTIARRVGAILNWTTVAMDAIIVQRAGTPINELVEKHGWPHFRDLEQALCEELAQGEHQVIDCGGGVVEREVLGGGLLGEGLGQGGLASLTGATEQHDRGIGHGPPDGILDVSPDHG